LASATTSIVPCARATAATAAAQPSGERAVTLWSARTWAMALSPDPSRAQAIMPQVPSPLGGSTAMRVRAYRPLSPSGEWMGEGESGGAGSPLSPTLSPEGEGDHAQHGGGVPLLHAPAARATSPSKLGEDWSPGPFTRTLIAVDPPSGDGTCGIIACAREGSGDSAIAHVLADHSVTALRPEGWAAAVAAAARAHGTVQVVAEANQGGEMIQAVLHTADQALRVKLVHARAGKSHRAEPVSHLFEAGRAFIHGKMPELEAQLLGLIAGGGYEGPGHSPDRADAMVWGITELMLGRRAEPKIWRV
jgi:hypothetical protein